MPSRIARLATHLTIKLNSSNYVVSMTSYIFPVILMLLPVVRNLIERDSQPDTAIRFVFPGCLTLFLILFLFILLNTRWTRKSPIKLEERKWIRFVIFKCRWGALSGVKICSVHLRLPKKRRLSLEWKPLKRDSLQTLPAQRLARPREKLSKCDCYLIPFISIIN